MSRDDIGSSTGDASPGLRHRDGHFSLLDFQNNFKN